MMRIAVGAVLLAVFGAACATRPVTPPDPLTATEHNDLGVAYFARGETGRAAAEFRRALALEPNFPRALANLGDALLAQGETAAAIEAYARARAASPEDPAIANNLAWALLQDDRRWHEAEPVIRAALGTNPEPRGYYLDTFGVLLLRKQETEGALAAFRAALADPGLSAPTVRALVFRHAAEALARLGDSQGARRCAELAETAASGGAPAKVGGDEGVC
jgi:tetratricopeptide (TPR) repeat protein